MIVQVAFEITNIGEIDTLSETFQAEFRIESKWTTHEKIDREYDPNVHWNPCLYVDNAVQIKESISYETDIQPTCTVITEIRDIDGTFWERLDLEYFPFDVQKLKLILTSRLSYDKLSIVKDPHKLSYIEFEAKTRFRDQQKWHLYRFVTLSDYTNYESNRIEKKIQKCSSILEISKARKCFSSPKLVAACYSARRPGFYIFNAFFLIFLITLISFSVFSIDLASPQFRLQSTFTILLSAISLKWSILKRLPSISYLTLLDLYQISSIFFICMLIAWHAIQSSYFTDSNLDNTFMIFFSLIFFMSHLLFFLWVYSINNKQRQLRKEEILFFNKYKAHFMSEV